VQPEVVLETRRSGETLIAFRTVKLLPKVNFLVFPKAPRLVEAPLTQGAAVGLLPGVGQPVSVHGARVCKALPAFRARKRPFSRVDFLVTLQLTFLGELLAAQRALVRFLPRMNPHVYLQRRELVTVSTAQAAAVGRFVFWGRCGTRLINKDHVTRILFCGVCGDTEMNRLSCAHVYIPMCIWTRY